jgi:hypothetical protein
LTQINIAEKIYARVSRVIKPFGMGSWLPKSDVCCTSVLFAGAEHAQRKKGLGLGHARAYVKNGSHKPPSAANSLRPITDRLETLRLYRRPLERAD